MRDQLAQTRFREHTMPDACRIWIECGECQNLQALPMAQRMLDWLFGFLSLPVLVKLMRTSYAAQPRQVATYASWAINAALFTVDCIRICIRFFFVTQECLEHQQTPDGGAVIARTALMLIDHLGQKAHIE